MSGHSAPTRVVVPLRSHPLRAAEPQEFALGPRPQRPDQGRRLPPNSPTAGRRAAGVCPWSPATAPRPRASFLSVPTHCGPPSRRNSPSVPGHSAPTRVVVYPPTHLLRAAKPQEFALGVRPQCPDQGRRSSPYPPTAGRRAAGVRPRSPATEPRLGSSFPPTHLLRAAEPQEFALGPRPQCPNHGRCSSPYPPTAGRRAAGVRPRSPATEPRLGSLSTPQLTYCGPPSRKSLPLVPGHSALTRVVVPLRTHPLRAAEPQEFALGPRPQSPD